MNSHSGQMPQRGLTRGVAVLAGGCFWCLEAVYEQLKGIESVESGYTGGTVRNPSYQQVTAGTTGHAEAVRIAFDPAIISFRDLLDVFFTIHDPTTLNRQGADVGTQYRSAVFFTDEEQEAMAAQAIRELDELSIWQAPVVTEVVPLTEFYPAEASHQEYYRRNPAQAYCRVVIAPKVAKFRKQNFARLKQQ